MTNLIPSPHGIAKIHKATGIPKTTLYQWARRPETIPVGKFAILAKAMNLTDEQILYFIRKEE